ncbi:CDP-glycerol glycerophosphotransferase family protein [Vibrio harveyi]|uniref:Uncharacterized protein n=1 Tax=Vibrio harveyi TaxID=669 RepID=A0ABM5XYG9_VIBHA|nr:CDP-glycerol glycerophosphotransferase family protein [Vibrio harveyi]AMF98141.1 hypothetical protein AL538_10710 [Vibrio harveyi]MBY7701402.1 CDP-glycerol glycerophosphotransferase family protein [Vibrio harveyi]PNM53132.1 hypothetical protein AL540_013190 [Vibrio harveyi]UIL57636.1 CDP-glycerol glycerophosphotransferase family protein [Vibrio harveyi]SQA27839.1 CDP-glycerol:poly(glycerophosphate) glycerophosphotransferase [Vibrio harveyi]
MIKVFDFIFIQLKKRSFREVLQRLLELIFGYPLLVLSFLSPRDKNKIVVGCHTKFNDNSKYFYLISKQLKPEKPIYWIANSKSIAEDMRHLGYESFYRWSFKGLYHSLTAKYYIFCFHIIDVNMWTWGGAVKINLWHGIPIKHIEFSANNARSSKVYNEKSLISRILVPYIFIKPDFLLSTSKKITSYYETAFRIKGEGRIKEFGMPRCDIFFMTEHERCNIIPYCENTLLVTEKIPEYKKTFIYMPTWRDYDFLNDENLNFELINESFRRHNYLLLVKFHPATSFCDQRSYSNIEFLDTKVDVYPILTKVDCLITDYSSIYYDFILLNKEIIFYAFDVESYIMNDRGFIEDYYKAMPGTRAYSLPSLLEVIHEENLLKADVLNSVYQERWDSFKGKSTEKILELIYESEK